MDGPGWFSSAFEVLVAIWTKKSMSTDDVNVRLAGLHAAIKRTVDRLNDMDLRRAGPFRCIFLAPEYLMTAPRSTWVNPKALIEDHRDEVLKSLLKVSKDFPGVLIVPGTIAFSKPLTRPASQQRKMDKTTGERTGPFKTSSRADKALRAFDNPWPFLEHERKLTNVNAPNAEMKKFADRKAAFRKDLDDFNTFGSGPLISAPEPHIFKNNAYVFLDGVIVHKYSKQADFFETLGDPHVHFIPGGGSGVTTIKGIDFGFEICMDHAMGTLGRTIAAHAARHLTNLGRRPKIHILLSDCTPNKTEHMTMCNDGFMFHASTEANYSGAFYRDMSGKVKVHDVKDALEPVGSEDNVAGGTLRFWKIVMRP